MLDSRIRSVHAYAIGCLAAYDFPLEWDQLKAVYYQPYKTPTFIIEETGVPIYSAESVIVSYDRAYLETVDGKEEQLNTWLFENIMEGN